METIRVNMTPCEDVQTIHASQNDNEAREWGFELHNNGDVIDSSEITDQLVFKAYKGGTEQILPENGSVPTTSPIIADIKYPQGELTDQEFLYRQSPTEDDGLAKIQTIYGNTLKWNQLVQNGNFADSSGWSTVSSASLTISNNIANITTVNTWSGLTSSTGWSLVSGHKYLFSASYKIQTNNYEVNVYSGNLFDFSTIPCVADNQWHTIQQIIACTQSGQSTRPSFDNRTASGSYSVKNIMLIDLTQMFGAGKEPTVEQFKSYFPLPYYSFQSILLPFKGTGIKTVGFNLFDQDSVLTNVGFVKQSDGSFYIQTPSIANYRVLFENKLKYSGQFFLVYKYKYESTTGQGCRFKVHYTDGSTDQIYAQGSNDFVEISFISRANKVLDYISGTYGYNIATWWKDVCINISDPSKNGTYEPYTSSTLSLPISTYFPSGMKSVPSAYDELTPNKAITRVGMVDLGSLTYVKEAPATAHPDWPLFYASVPGALGRYGAYGNTQICAKYSNRAPSAWQDKTIGFGAASTNINIADTAFADYTVDQVKQALSGVMLYYKLATQTETEFTTASLVTENAEIPLSNEDGVLIGKCIEQLSSESGFFDAKIKLADADGECYSNKIQLHVERKPS